MSYIDPRSKSLWHLEQLQELKASGKTSAPVNVEIDLSNRCSLGCSWCHFGYTHTRGPLTGKQAGPEERTAGGDLMDVQLAYSIFAQLAGAGVRSVTFTGGGEPTLHPHFDSIVRNAANAGLQVGLYTHGGHIDNDRAGLLKNFCTWVYVSLDECTPEAYKQSKGVDGFERATSGIARLTSAEGQATIGVGFLLHAGNYQQSRQMAELGRRLGADYVQFRPTIHYAPDTPSQRTENTGWMGAAVERLRVHSNDPFVLVDLARFDDYRTWQGHGYQTCYWPGMQTVITPNGRVWRCVNKREHAGALLGDLAEESFAAIWQRAGGACTVDSQCRVMCRGHVANQTINAVMTEPTHSAFI